MTNEERKEVLNKVKESKKYVNTYLAACKDLEKEGIIVDKVEIIPLEKEEN